MKKAIPIKAWIPMRLGDKTGVLTPSGWFRATRSDSWLSAERLAHRLTRLNVMQPMDDHSLDYSQGNVKWEYIGVEKANAPERTVS